MINKDDFILHNVKKLSDARYVFSHDDGWLELMCDKGAICGVPFESSKYLVMDITGITNKMCSVTWGFWENTAVGRWFDIGFKIGLFPQLKTRIAIPFSALDGNTLFLPRTPGKLKTITQGRPVKLKDIVKFAMSVSAATDDTVIEIHDFFISDGEPEYPVEPKIIVDALGQKKNSEWKNKTKSGEELTGYLNEALLESAQTAGSLSEITALNASHGRSMYGGWLSKRFDASGYFTLKNDGRRYWLADPDGYAFFSAGLDCVRVDGECNIRGIECLCEYLPPKGSAGWSDRGSFSWHAANLYRAFGEKWFECWADITKSRMLDWGFNTTACWSDINYIKRSKQPYVYFMSGFPKTEKMIFRDFPDVFSDEYKVNSEKWAKQLAPLSLDKILIGYFMSNEPNWAFVNGINLAAMTLESEEISASKSRLIEYLKNIYSDIFALNSAWGSGYESFDDLLKPVRNSELSDSAKATLMQFTAEMIREYIRVPALESKKAAPNHLNLGIRYAWLSSKTLASGSEYVDVFSFNCYSMDPSQNIRNFSELVGKPVLIGEFHFGALDRGLDATGLRAVRDQTERGKAYRRYMHLAAADPNCLGAHYFTLNDQGYLGRFDGENYQIGLVDVCNRPYDEFVDYVRRTNYELYDIADGRITPTDEKAVETAVVAF